MRWLSCGEADLPDNLDWLSEREAARLSRYRFRKRYNEYLLRRYTGKVAAATALGLAHDERALARVEVLNRPTGAPYVQVDGEQAPLDISLTDRAGWAVSLVGEVGSMRAGTLGVDLEIVEERTPGFVSDFLTPAESAWVNSMPDADRYHEAANLLWSAKEAALKVQRVGLRADTRTVVVTASREVRPDGWRELSIATSAGEVFPGWWRRDGIYLLTLASLEATPPPERMPGGGDLATAVPVHSWMNDPMV